MLKRTAKPENAQPAAKRKLTRAERKQIEAIIRQAKGDGRPHTVQDSIPFRNLYPDGLCRLDDRLFSKTIAYEDVNYRLAGPDEQRDIFERLCDFYNIPLRLQPRQICRCSLKRSRVHPASCGRRVRPARPPKRDRRIYTLSAWHRLHRSQARCTTTL